MYACYGGACIFNCKIFLCASSLSLLTYSFCISSNSHRPSSVAMFCSRSFYISTCFFSWSASLSIICCSTSAIFRSSFFINASLLATSSSSCVNLAWSFFLVWLDWGGSCASARFLITFSKLSILMSRSSMSLSLSPITYSELSTFSNKDRFSFSDS